MFINDAPKPKKSLLATKEGYRSEINTYFADDNIIMTSGKQDHPPKGANKGQFGNKRFRTIVQKCPTEKRHIELKQMPQNQL